MTVSAAVLDGGQPRPGIRTTVGAATGFHALEQAVVECPPGGSIERATADCEEVLFVLRGSGQLRVDDAVHPLEPECGAYLAPGESYELVSAEGLCGVLVRIPDPEPDSAGSSGSSGSSGSGGARALVRRLVDQEAEAATSQREFRIVADPSSGLRSATHFVGYIPTARAPDHFHTYDEVIYVIEGEGAFHAGETHEPIGPGSCIQLPARTVHCLENTGSGIMRVVAVFRPAGSPAAAYYPDGTPAYYGAAPIEESESKPAT